jgi:hypothetical protein
MGVSGNQTNVLRTFVPANALTMGAAGRDADAVRRCPTARGRQGCHALGFGAKREYKTNKGQRPSLVWSGDAGRKIPTGFTNIRGVSPCPQKSPTPAWGTGLCIRSLAVTYFHMGRPHTIIGAEQFHYRVRDGIGWFPLAIAARQTFLASRVSANAQPMGNNVRKVARCTRHHLNGLWPRPFARRQRR